MISPTPTVVTSASSRQTRSPLVLFVVFAAMVLCTIGVLALNSAGFVLHRENGPMEMFQAAILLLGAAVWGRAAQCDTGGRRILAAGLGLTYFTFVVLEVDVRPFEIPWLTALLNGTIRNIWLGSLWLGAFIWFTRAWRETLGAFFIWVRTLSGILLVAAALPWLASYAIDKLHLIEPAGRGLFFEELIEVNAVILMIASALVALKDSRRR